MDLSSAYLDFLKILESFPGLEPQMKLLEIGGGYGCLASVFLRVTKCSYWLVDIPPSLYLSQEYLSQLFPDRKIFKFRHFERFDDIQADLLDSDICFLTPNQLEMLPDRAVNIGLNINGFGDMTAEQVKNYSAIFQRICSVGVYLRNTVNAASQAESYSRTLNDMKWTSPSTEDYLLKNTNLIRFRGHELEDGYSEIAYRTSP